MRDRTSYAGPAVPTAAFCSNERMAPDNPRRRLATAGNHEVWHAFERAYLSWPGGELFIADHYGDPTCAVIDVAGGWCMTGGEGLVLCRFDAGLPVGSAQTVPRMQVRELWRRSNPPPSDACWFVSSLAPAAAGKVHVATDAAAEYRGFYEVDVATMAWRRA